MNISACLYRVQGFYIYLFIVSILFLTFVYVFLLRSRSRRHRRTVGGRQTSEQTAALLTAATSNKIVDPAVLPRTGSFYMRLGAVGAYNSSTEHLTSGMFVTNLL